ncbi:MAG TPA: methionyl-tRNA formyltransferase [Candidatus Hydrogenedentes bacterium]|nr:methionyl-tRNA formyltransferase [Candidatus Hydrogenedentota bacterium]HPG69425.1 methionyl-tRNA formyltransferase [Candidatus Hydrogenedentota bacterium]
MRIAVAGSGQLATGIMDALRESSHQVVAVVLNGRVTKGVFRRILPMYMGVLGGGRTTPGYAYRAGLPVVWIDRMAEDLEPLRAFAPDVLLVAGFSVILKRPILDLPRIGCVNVHSSLLPKHRGPNPFCWALLDGDRRAGVTFHIMDEGIDTGDIIEQVAFDIEPDDTALDVYNRASAAAADRIVEVMDRVESEGLRGTPQDPAVASYDRKLTAEDAFIDWSQPAVEIARRARAFYPMLLPRFRFRGRIVRLSRFWCDESLADAAPGTALNRRRPIRVATGRGVFVVDLAHSARPLPWLWPAPWTRPRLGEKLE